jgi:hypothetical protein
MDKLNVTSYEFRRVRTRSLISLGGLIVKSGLLETFEISLGLDLQRDPDQKQQVAALFKGLVELNEMAQSDDVHFQLWGAQGLQLLGEEEGNHSKV